MNLSFFSINGIPMVKPGDDLVNLINDGLIGMNEAFQNEDVLVIAQKIISKAHTPVWSSTSEHIAFYDVADPSWFNSSGGLILRGGGMSVVTANGTLIHSTGTSTDSFDWNG